MLQICASSILVDAHISKDNKLNIMIRDETLTELTPLEDTLSPRRGFRNYYHHKDVVWVFLA